DAALTAFGPRAYQLYLTAARYRITRSRDDLEAFLALTTAGPRVLPGLIPVAALPHDRPELSLSYPLQDVLDSGWKEAVKLPFPEVPDLELTPLRSEERPVGQDCEFVQ